MKAVNKIVFVLFLLFGGAAAMAQTPKNTDEQLALQFYSNKEYDKAVIYYEKLYDKNPHNYYEYYLTCLVKTNDMKKAEKMVKKQIKLKPGSVYLYVDLGELYKAQQEDKKAEEQYQKAIKDLPDDYTQIASLANAFKTVKLYDYAIQTFEKASKMNNGLYPYYYEKADIYKEKGDIKTMINTYLDALEFKESEMITIQNNLQNSLGYDDEKGGFNNPILKQELQKRIQANPNKTIFSEFLIYIQMQQKDFEGAFTQSKALDKRNKEDGYRLMELGKICTSNEAYDVAEKCYNYVLAKGKENYNYNQAYIESSNAQYDKIVKQRTFTPDDLKQLELKLNTTIAEFGINQLTVPLLRKLANLYAYYLNDLPKASELLTQAVELPGIDKFVQAECKLDLGDVTLITGNVWDASLLYSQVEKAFKYDPVGQEAKFRNAKLSYYNGDFKWAKAQLDVLKGATSKLIANDAMDLSLLIGDAINVDTNEVPLQMFASADLLIIQNKIPQALARMDSINILFDNHGLADDIYYKKGIIFLKQNKPKEALEAFQRVVDTYGEEIFGDDAMFKIAEIYQYNLNDTEKAKASYQDMLTKYPASVYTVEARKRFRKLRGDLIN
ncbi:MAG TPA: tetratricopeptide repeat protein [Bacteroidia bacterium]